MIESSKEYTLIRIVYTVEGRVHVVNIEVPREGLTGTDFVDELVRPAMLAAGYHPNTVKLALGDE